MAELIDPRGVADLLGVQIKTVHQWRFREEFPEPDQYFGRTPVWRKAEVLKWAKKTGRLK